MTPSRPGLFAGLVALILVAAFFPVLSNGYVWDDHMFFGLFPADIYFASWWATGSEPFTIAANYFRPVAMATYLLDFAGGPAPATAHLVNLLFHGLNASLVGALAWRLLGLRSRDVSAWPVAVAGLWYGLHVALIEPVAWLSCRFDLVATSCVLLLLHASLSAARWALPAMALLFAAALMGKENAAGLIAAWPFWVVALAALRGAERPRAVAVELLKGWTALGAGLLLDLALRLWARGYVWQFGDGAGGGASDHLERIAMSLAEQVRLMIFPFGAVDPLHTVASFDPVNHVIAAAALSGAVFAMTRGPARPWAALGLAAVAALVPTSNLIPIPYSGDVYTADRYLTLPLVFVAPALAAAVQAVFHSSSSLRHAVAALLVVWLLGSTALIRVTLPLMKDDETFWSWVRALHPEEALARDNLADALVEKARFAEALAILEPVTRAGESDAAAWHTLARARDGLGQPALAMDAVDRAVALKPADERYWHTKAALAGKAGDLVSAESILRERVLTLNPGMGEAHLNLIRLLLVTERRAEAEAYVRAHGPALGGNWRGEAAALLGPARS